MKRRSFVTAVFGALAVPVIGAAKHKDNTIANGFEKYPRVYTDNKIYTNDGLLIGLVKSLSITEKRDVVIDKNYVGPTNITGELHTVMFDAKYMNRIWPNLSGLNFDLIPDRWRVRSQRWPIQIVITNTFQNGKVTTTINNVWFTENKGITYYSGSGSGIIIISNHEHISQPPKGGLFFEAESIENNWPLHNNKLVFPAEIIR